jgi:diguanylate cyclase
VSQSHDNVTLDDTDRPIDLLPINDVDSEYASSMAGRALQLMALHNVPATPQNFEVWFTFARGTAPDLNKTVNILLANKRPFDAGTNHSLYVSYIEGRSDWAQHTLLSAELQRVLLNAQQFLATTLTDNRRQVEALDTVASQMDENCDPRPIIKSLVGELSKAVSRATELEAHFTASLHELDNIRDKLTISERRSRTDPLTGLANRRALDDFVRGAQIASMETGAPLSIMLVDIDRFKLFNDKFGHQFGDQVLRLIAHVLKENMRKDDLAVRYGGEELLAILPGADLLVCQEVAERVRQTIARRQVRRRSTGKILSTVTVSIGVAQFVAGESLSDFIERCDRALYVAKRAGRNRTVTEREISESVAA